MQAINAVGKRDTLDERQFRLLQGALVETARLSIRMRTDVWAAEFLEDWVQEVSFDPLTDMSAPTVGGKYGEASYDVIDTGVRVTQALGYIRKGFRIHTKDLAASRQLGRDLDTGATRDIARQMAELENSILINGNGVVGEGLLNATGRTTVAGTDWDAAGDPYDDVRKAIVALQDVEHMGPFKLIVSPTQNGNLLKARTAADKTHREMIDQHLGLGAVVVDSQMANTSAILVEGPNPMNFEVSLGPDFAFQAPIVMGEWTKMTAWLGLATKIKRAVSICEITGV